MIKEEYSDWREQWKGYGDITKQSRWFHFIALMKMDSIHLRKTGLWASKIWSWTKLECTTSSICPGPYTQWALWGWLEQVYRRCQASGKHRANQQCIWWICIWRKVICKPAPSFDIQKPLVQTDFADQRDHWNSTEGRLIQTMLG